MIESIVKTKEEREVMERKEDRTRNEDVCREHESINGRPAISPDDSVIY